MRSPSNVLEKKQGDLDQARHWYQQAIATGHPKITGWAQSELRSLGRRERDRQEAERFGRYGYLAYAEPTLMSRDGHAARAPGCRRPRHWHPW